MFKSNDKVTFIGHGAETRREPRPGDKIKPGDELDYVIEPGKEIVIKGMIGSLHALYIPVKLPDGEIRHVLYADLTFGKGNKCSFKNRLPEWKGVKKDKEGIYREVIVPGKTVTVRGIMVLTDLHIPVLVENEIRQIPYEKLTFEKEAK